MNLRGGILVAGHVWRALADVVRSAAAALLQLLQLLLVLLILLMLLKLRHSHPLHKYCPTEMLIFVVSKCMYTSMKVENHKIISLLLSRKKASIELLLSGIFRLRTSFLLPQPVAFLQLEVFQLGQQHNGI